MDDEKVFELIAGEWVESKDEEEKEEEELWHVTSPCKMHKGVCLF